METDKKSLLQRLAQSMGIKSDAGEQVEVSRKEISRKIKSQYRSGNQLVTEWEITYEVTKQNKKLKKAILDKLSNSQDKLSYQFKLVNIAKSMVGSSDYSYFRFKGNFVLGQPKCNLFVADCLLQAGVDLQLFSIDAPTRVKVVSLYTCDKKLMRPPTASMWADKNYDPERFIVVGQGKEGLEKSQPGDVISDGKHCGIISGKRKVISASIITNTVVQNDWGWREGECDKVVIRRYKPKP